MRRERKKDRKHDNKNKEKKKRVKIIFFHGKIDEQLKQRNQKKNNWEKQKGLL